MIRTSAQKPGENEPKRDVGQGPKICSRGRARCATLLHPLMLPDRAHALPVMVLGTRTSSPWKSAAGTPSRHIRPRCKTQILAVKSPKAGTEARFAGPLRRTVPCHDPAEKGAANCAFAVRECVSAVPFQPANRAVSRRIIDFYPASPKRPDCLAERQGFEPWVPSRARRISSAVLSTTQPPLR